MIAVDSFGVTTITKYKDGTAVKPTSTAVTTKKNTSAIAHRL